jgi:transposase
MGADAMHQDRHEAGGYRRIELITGRRKRRNWTATEKAQILSESAEPDANISDVARRWGVNRGLLSTWRRQAGLTGSATAARAGLPLFVPITVATASDRCGRDGETGRTANLDHEMPDQAVGAPGRIEVTIGSGRMVATGPVDPALAAAIVEALRETL